MNAFTETSKIIAKINIKRHKDEDDILKNKYSVIALSNILIEIHSLLNRVSKGIIQSHLSLQKELKTVKGMFKDHRLETSLAYATLAKQFEEYKESNDLDGYFARGLNAATRKAVLEMVAELESSENDDENNEWLERLIEFR